MKNSETSKKNRFVNFFAKIKSNVKGYFDATHIKFKKFFTKENLSYDFDKYKAFTALQAREVFSKESQSNERKDKIIRIVLMILKFVVVVGVAYALCFVIGTFGVILPKSFFSLFVFFTTIMFVLQLISTIVSSTKNYYISEDNKVLITFPSKGASLFLSKMTIEYLKQLKNTVDFYLPVSIGIIIYTALTNPLSPLPLYSVVWIVFPVIVMVAIIVLLGSLISVLYLQYLRLVKIVPAVRLVLVGAIFALIIYGAVLLIGLIPPDLNLLNTWNTIRANIDSFLNTFSNVMVPVSWFCNSIVGVTSPSYKGYRLNGACFGKFFAVLGCTIVLFFIVFFVVKALFLHMMTKSVDYEKVNEKAHHRNHVHHKHSTFAFKELKISFRTFEVSATYIVTYVLIPLLIYLICKIFDAINTSMKGNMLSIMFIVLLIVLPLLASNAPLASAYSREGHAGYIKKTKPIQPTTPMLSKLLFNLILSIPSIFVSMYIVGIFGKIDIGTVIIVGVCVLLLQYAHIFYSSTLDFVNPKNENYQIEGQNAKNSNENISTVVAFVISFLFAFLVFFFFQEQVLAHAETFLPAAIRLLIICILTFGSCLLLYFLKMKAYFMEK
ncbi:MAG: hypothetical protein KBS97_02225 [Firmicutes bacterium]|nr:hypothetical protein [Candidatus Fiminaster equi]